MIFLAENLRALREAKNLTQQGIADDLELKKSAYSNYENKISKPSFEILKRIADYYGTLVDVLLYTQNTKDLFSKNKPLVQPIVNPAVNPIAEKAPSGGKSPRIIELQKLADETKANFGKIGEYNVHDLDGRAAAGQAIALLESDKVRSKPNMFLPDLGPGLHIRLTADGDSMFPVIKNGDKPVSTWVPDLKNLHSGEVCLVIDVNDGGVYKRIYKKSSTHLVLESFNENYKPYLLHLEEVRAVFRVQQLHSNDLHNYGADIRRDVDELKRQVGDIRTLLQHK